jgi:hypothetical protein
MSSSGGGLATAASGAAPPQQPTPIPAADAEVGASAEATRAGLRALQRRVWNQLLTPRGDHATAVLNGAAAALLDGATAGDDALRRLALRTPGDVVQTARGPGVVIAVRASVYVEYTGGDAAVPQYVGDRAVLVEYIVERKTLRSGTSSRGRAVHGRSYAPVDWVPALAVADAGAPTPSEISPLVSSGASGSAGDAAFSPDGADADDPQAGWKPAAAGAGRARLARAPRRARDGAGGAPSARSAFGAGGGDAAGYASDCEGGGMSGGAGAGAPASVTDGGGDVDFVDPAHDGPGGGSGGD